MPQPEHIIEVVGRLQDEFGAAAAIAQSEHRHASDYDRYHR